MNLKYLGVVKMKLSYILAVMITTVCIYALFYGLKNINIKEESKMNDNYFIIRYPSVINKYLNIC